MELWLDTSAINGVEYDPDLVPDPIPWAPQVEQEVVFHLDANDSESITLSNDDVAEWIDKSGNGYDMIAQGHPRLVDYGYGTDLKVVHFESNGAKEGGDSLYSQKLWDTSTGDFTMFAVARYASEDAGKVSNYVISDRIKRPWHFGFGQNSIGFTVFGGAISTSVREEHYISLVDSTVSIGESLEVATGSISCVFTTTTTDVADALNGLLNEINSELSTSHNSFLSGSRIIIRNRTSGATTNFSVSSNLFIDKSPPNGNLIDEHDAGFHLIAANMDGDLDLANVWLDIRPVTQYENGAYTTNNHHFPKFLQFGGNGNNRGFSTCEIGEFIAFNKVLSEEERQTVEGYLSDRWKQMLNLDPSHPYYSVPPAWSPSNEDSLEAWFDANDSSTINKNFVKKWKDRANENEFAQMELLLRPAIIENAINGLPAIDFDGQKDFLSIHSRFGLHKNPDLTILAVSITDSLRVSLNREENNVTAAPVEYQETKGPQNALDQDLSTSYFHPDGNQSTMTFELLYASRVTAVSFTSSNNEDTRSHDPALFVLEGLEANGSYSLIDEKDIPAFSGPNEQQFIAFENDQNFTTYRITFSNNQSDFNESLAIELAEIELLGVPDSDQWLSTSPLFHLGGQAHARILATAPGSWRFNGGEVNYSPVEPNSPNIQAWIRQKSSDYNSSKLFLNGTEQIVSEISNPDQYPLDTNPYASIGAGFGMFGNKMPFDGKIGELIVLQDASDETRKKFEGYLAHKWGLSHKLPNNHPYKTEFNALFTPPTPVLSLKDQSGNGNHASQSNPASQPGLRIGEMNGENIVQFDGNDFLTFERPINSIRSVFLVAKRVSGNRGFLLGHSQNYGFQTGDSTI